MDPKIIRPNLGRMYNCKPKKKNHIYSYMNKTKMVQQNMYFQFTTSIRALFLHKMNLDN